MAAPSTRPAAERRRHQRPGHERPPELLEHEHRVGPAQTVRAEVEHAQIAELAPAAAIHAAVGFEAPDGAHVEASGEQGGDGVDERDLVVGALEVHRSGLPRS